MNQFTQHEHAASIMIRRCARGLAETYAQPCDVEAAMLALLRLAAEDEMKAQGMTNFFNGDE